MQQVAKDIHRWSLCKGCSRAQQNTVQGLGSKACRWRCTSIRSKKSWRLFSQDQDEETRLLEEDMKRLSERQSQRPAQDRMDRRSDREDSQEQVVASNGPKELLDKVLIADFFFVCTALLALGAGVAESSVLHTRSILDIWFPLWNVVFQPAIGVLMLGALASGGLGWLESRKNT